MPLKRICLTFAFALLAVCAYSQADITASVDKSSLSLNEEINLVITVRASVTDIDTPQMPSLPNFNIYSSGQSRNVSMANGRVSTLQKFTYILTPRFAGKSVIGAFKIKVDSKEYSTQPIEVEVFRDGSKNNASSARSGGKNEAEKNIPRRASSAGATPTAPDFFMTATVDKQEAYLNEQILLKVRFYQSQSTLGNPQYDRPKMESLVPEEIKTNQESQTIDGKQYIYTEFVTALFGILPGKGTVGPASVQYNIVKGDNGMDTFDLFFNAAANAESKIVKSDPVTIQINALPKDNRPKSFYGAVGTDYAISASVDNAKPQAGEPVTLNVSVKGNGNMRAISDIPVPDMGANFRVYDTTSSSSTNLNGYIVGGVKTFKTVLVPRVSGNFEIAPIEFSYFDTAQRAYKTISTSAIALAVSPSSVSASNTAISFAEEAAPAASRVEKLNNDISYIKNGNTSAFTLFAAFFGGLGKINWFVFVLILGSLAISLFKKSEMPYAAKKKAFKVAKKELASAKTFGEVSQALTKYLEAKRGANIGIMTISDVADEFKLNPLNSQALAKLWGEFEMLKYAPAHTLTSTIAVSEAVERTLILLKEIEKEIK